MEIISARHPFWGPATSPRLGAITLVTSHQRRLSQASSNRLDDVSIPAIVGRIALAPEIQTYLAGVGKPVPRGYAQRPALKTLPISEAERAILLSGAANPSAEELATLKQIDNLFTLNFPNDVLTTNMVCYYSLPAQRGAFGPAKGKVPPPASPGISALIEYLNPPPGDLAPSQDPGPHNDFTHNAFWCPDPGAIGPSIFKAYMPRYWNLFTFAGMFGIDVNARWGDMKVAAQNGLIMLNVKSSYPFPPPLDISVDYVWALSPIAADLPKIANLGSQIDPEVFRAWLTMAILENYDQVSDQIVKDQKTKAKKEKRKALVKGIGIAVAGVVLSFIIPGIMAAAVTLVKAAVSFYIAAEERKKAAKAMSEAQRMFDTDAPAFAAEIQKAADMVDAAAAQEAADQPLSPEELSAIQQVQDETPTSTGTYVVGGVAATGALAILISLFR